LIAEGLLEVVSVNPLPAKASEHEKRTPVQFRTLYRLSTRGEFAAEYGECEYAKSIALPKSSPNGPAKPKSARSRGRKGK